MNFQIRFDLPFYLILIFAVVAVGLSFFMYRRTENLSRGRRIFLGTLRSLVIFLLLLAAANLVTDFVNFRDKKRDVAVLVDDSQSMTIKDRNVPRSKVITEMLRSAEMDSLKKYFNVVPLAFGGDILKESVLDSLKFNQPATNLESALVAASKLDPSDDIAFSVLLTDGDYNEGGNPLDAARGMRFPVYAIGIGDSTEPKDIVVQRIIPPPLAYADRKSTVESIISARGFGGKTVDVFLSEDEKQIDTKQITLPESGEIEVPFNYTPEKAGTHVLTVDIPPQAGEFSRKNNSSSTTAEVQKGKYEALLVAGEPTPDVAFLRRNMEDSRDFDVRVLVQKSADEFFEKDAGNVLSEKYDVVCLYDFPNSYSQRTAADVLGILRSRDIPYVYFAGKNFSIAGENSLPRSPFKVRDFQSGEFLIGVSPAPSSSVPLGLQSLYSLIAANSNLFPPIFYQRIVVALFGGSSTLALPVINGNVLGYPLFIVNQSRRSAAFLGYGLWRLQLMSSVSGLRPDFLQSFVTTLLRTLLSTGNQRLLTVQTSKRIYDPSESVRFNSLLVDQAGTPVSDASIDVNLINDASRESSADIQLSPVGSGSYTGSVSGLGEGRYTFVANAKKGGETLGSDSGTVLVAQLNREYAQPSMNAQLLRQIAAATDGKFMTPSQFLRGDLQFDPEMKTPVQVSTSNRFEILSSLPILAVVIVLLGVEWVMRKVWGLP